MKIVLNIYISKQYQKTITLWCSGKQNNVKKLAIKRSQAQFFMGQKLKYT